MSDAPADARAAARDALKDSIDMNQSDILEALKSLYGDSYAAGGLAAAQGLPATSLSADLSGVYGTTDTAAAWAAWEPGNAAAAGLLSDGGLANLLEQADATVNGVTGSMLDRLGTVLADGVHSGDSIDKIAGDMSGIIVDPQRAYVIANTETARAVEAGSQNQYAAQGVQQWEWLLSPDACDDCQDDQSGGPYDVGDGPDLPGHPNCRCSSSPIDPGSDTSEDTAAVDDSGSADAPTVDDSGSADAPTVDDSGSADAPTVGGWEGDTQSLIDTGTNGNYSTLEKWNETYDRIKDLPKTEGTQYDYPIDAYKEYTGNGYKSMNGLLRGTYNSYDNEYVAKKTVLMDRAFAEAGDITTEPAVFQRGVKAFGTFDPATAYAKGTVVQESGYLSMTAEMNNYTEGFAGDTGWTMNIYVPPGQKTLPGTWEEREVILDRGATHQVTKVDSVTRTIWTQVIP